MASTITGSASSASETPLAAPRQGPWIRGPWLNLVVDCGAGTAPLLLLTAYFSSASTKGWSFAFYALALLFNYPHFMATAAELNRSNLELREAYACGLIVAGRDADAYALYRNLLARSPQNANALVNYGLLAQRLGHPEEAVDSWQRASGMLGESKLCSSTKLRAIPRPPRRTGTTTANSWAVTSNPNGWFALASIAPRTS